MSTAKQNIDDAGFHTHFTLALLSWYTDHGRKTLPWQRDRDPYKVWLSEIMLQQTQVETVIGYFEKFLRLFPTITDLANASEDQVMAQWAGLGYYARARNLHKSAKIIAAEYNGIFPCRFDEVVALPGIGPSTAGAILAFCFKQRHPILDGNVKRVLTRYFAVDGYPGEKKVSDQLWQLADKLTPDNKVDDYTQAIMDLGATVCKRNKPTCGQCPVSSNCQAHILNTVSAYPARKKPKIKNKKSTRMLIIQRDDHHVLLYKRPPSGIWGGLWSLPQLDDPLLIDNDWIQANLNIEVQNPASMQIYKHSFTHFDLSIQPIVYDMVGSVDAVMDGDNFLWYNLNNENANQAVGLPTAVKRILETLIGARQ